MRNIKAKDRMLPCLRYKLSPVLVAILTATISANSFSAQPVTLKKQVSVNENKAQAQGLELQRQRQ